ncbi:hypothetical protein Rsub_06754 [Raphidocelis subcapitata]|uniref:C3H1-type domain-containing protein n=1 Tax=Raphidocelis subcapitata TaxID=307507 RepID=A0A2V0P191_9CHLO|nr:hypothetical protein Rsub_06754 [Raphidocelis subcapitata]|eukprot:GBF93651.1 hypothetical protein Rsub_06754 [Raphidocelis subcapitata]
MANGAAPPAARVGRPNPYSDDFLMWTYKVEVCARGDNHDWARCPYAHDKEKARRRDPRRYNYASLPCPDAMQGRACPRGDACPYTHCVQEYWLHPDRFKTQMCKNGARCNRPLCFFAHAAGELRFPDSDLPELSSDPFCAPAAAALAAAPSAPLSPAAAGAAGFGAALAALDARRPGGTETPALSELAAAPRPPLSAPLLMLPSAEAVAAADCMPQDLFPSLAPPTTAGLCRATTAPLFAPLLPAPAPLDATQAAAVASPQQLREVHQRRSVLEQQRLALDMWLEHLQQREAALCGALAAAGLSCDDPGSPLSVVPRLPSATSSASHLNSGPFCLDLDPHAPALVPAPPAVFGGGAAAVAAAVAAAQPPPLAPRGGGLFEAWPLGGAPLGGGPLCAMF